MEYLFENKLYGIRFLQQEDLPVFMEFLAKEWSSTHIFLKSQKLFDWQHLGDDGYNFLLAVDKNSREILGILGYIPMSQFTATQSVEKFGAIWQVTENAPLGLGMKLMNILIKDPNRDFFGAVGISEIAKNLYTILGFQTGELNHYYLPNANVKQPVICANPRYSSSQSTPSELDFKILENIEDISLQHPHKPSKNIQYLINRYQQHPIYNYLFYGVYKNTELLSIWVIRKQGQANASCLRIVDMFGRLDIDASLTAPIQKILLQENAEYIDCLNYGVAETSFAKMGFQKLDQESDTIIPNYFEPFVQENIKIEFAIKTDYPDIVLFKGDSDQDRPNQLPL